tara:strand:- start:60 stop:212 length:153 start_codon:yes stop_codon:yes gene_type:complete
MMIVIRGDDSSVPLNSNKVPIPLNSNKVPNSESGEGGVMWARGEAMSERL